MIKFKDLNIDEYFECYGDEFLHYGYPKVCRCIKLDENRAAEVNGIKFYMNDEDLVKKLN